MDAPTGSATVGTEFVTTGTDGRVARFADRSVVTEALRPEVFEFVTESRREGKAGTSPWRLTLVHRYGISPEGTGCRVVYDATAVAHEETPAEIGEEFRRRARIGAGGFQSLGLLFPPQ